MTRGQFNTNTCNSCCHVIAATWSTWRPIPRPALGVFLPASSQIGEENRRHSLNPVHLSAFEFRCTLFDVNEKKKASREEETLIFRSKMDPEGSLPEVVPKSVLNQTDISTGIGPTGTDTPAPKDIMPHADHLDHSLEEPLSRPRGALFQVGSGSTGGRVKTYLNLSVRSNRGLTAPLPNLRENEVTDSEPTDTGRFPVKLLKDNQ